MGAGRGTGRGHRQVVALYDGEDRGSRSPSSVTGPSGRPPGCTPMGVAPAPGSTGSSRPASRRSCCRCALARLGAVQNPIIPIYREREVGFAIAPDDAEFFSSPATGAASTSSPWPATHRRAARRRRRSLVAYDDLPEGDPATLPAGARPTATTVRWIYYTSGTTSDPRACSTPTRTLIAGGLGPGRGARPQPDDVGSIAFPYAHIGGPDYIVMMLLTGLRRGADRGFDPGRPSSCSAGNGVTMAGGGTAFYHDVPRRAAQAAGDADHPDAAAARGGGAPKPPEVYTEVAGDGRAGCHGYGMTECPMIAQGGPDDTDDAARRTPTARRSPGARCASSRTTAPWRPGEDGEVRLKGPMVFKGYTDPSLDADAFDEEGWFRTGDLGHARPDGHVMLTGRLKDVIIRKGENISAKEIEDLLYPHPKVGDVAVIGLPDRERGERVCAVRRDRRRRRAARRSPRWSTTCKGTSLMVQKIPEQLEVVDALPRNDTLGKVLKTDLRDQFRRRALEPRTPPLSIAEPRRARRRAQASVRAARPGATRRRCRWPPTPAPARR